MTLWLRLTLGLLSMAPLYAFADDAAKADAALNANYKSLLSQLDGANQQRLRDAQRAWIAFRDKECSFRAQGSEGGTASALASSGCLAELSQQRADALKRQLDCPEGDITCVPRNRAVAETGADVACSKSAGQLKAEAYVQQCQQVSPATHPPCNVANACDLMIDEIKRGCAMIDKNAPAFCASYAK
ncbi:MAG: lysozyme inhibitor LprI family protein [Dokdonella sp.]